MTDNYRRPLGAWLEAGRVDALIVAESAPVTAHLIPSQVYPETELVFEQEGEQ